MPSYHPTGVVVEIVGIAAGDQGRSCNDHPDYCGEVLQEDVIVRIRKVQVIIGGKEVKALAAIWVTDGVDYCHVGFLPCHFVPHADDFDGTLAQVTKNYDDDPLNSDTAERRKHHSKKGCCITTIISTSPSIDGHSFQDELVHKGIKKIKSNN